MERCNECGCESTEEKQHESFCPILVASESQSVQSEPQGEIINSRLEFRPKGGETWEPAPVNYEFRFAPERP